MSRAVVGGDFPGALPGIAPCDLAGTFARETTVRAGVSGADGGQTVFGHVMPTARGDMQRSRVAAIRAGVPGTAPSRA